MDLTAIAGFCSLGVAIFTNILIAIYNQGKTAQRHDSFARETAARLSKLEKRQSAINGDIKELLKQVSVVEGRLMGGSDEG